MKPVHGSCLDEPELLHQVVLQELKGRGIDVKLETPKPPKKSLVSFSTPSNTPHTNSVVRGRIFGRRLGDLSKLLVSLEDSQDTDVLVPKLVVSACKYIEENIRIEGIYRMSGSAARQKAMRKEIDHYDTDFREMNPAPSVLDVASLLKQFLRELPLPMIPRIFHSVLASSFASPPSNMMENLMLCLLLLPSEHLACLSFLLHHFRTVAQNSCYNKMTASNLAIVLAPNLLPIQEPNSPPNINMGVAKLDKKTVDLNNQKLKLHTNILELLIQNSDSVGYLNSYIQERYEAFLTLPSYGGTSHSEDNLDDESNGPSKRKSKKKHVRRRSGSLSRVLSVMGKNIQKAMGRNSSTPGTKIDPSSIHSTPLPQFGGTPDYPSPRGTNAKRKATGDHELSPNSKQQKRTFESTFTPKMRTRTFSVKRFKRRKSEGKLKPAKESLLIHIKNTPKSTIVDGSKRTPSISSPLVKRHTRLSLASTTTPELRSSTATLKGCSTATLTQENVDDMELSDINGTEDVNGAKTNYNNVLDEDYAEVKAQYEEMKREVSRLESTESVDSCVEVDERYEAACAAGNLAKETRETARQLARVRRRSSENKKPRSPSQRRIGVIRRKSREREEKLNRQGGKSPERPSQRSPTCKPALTPLNFNRPSLKTKLQRGHPNTTSVGLEKPSPVLGEEKLGCKPRIKMSFKEKTRPVIDVSQGPLKATLSPLKRGSPLMRGSPSDKKKLTHGDSIASLRNNISDLIERSFGSGDQVPSNSGSVAEGDNEVFDICDGVGRNEVFDCRMNLDKEVYDEKNDLHELTDQIQNISFKNKSPMTPLERSPLPSTEDFFNQSSPVTRAQLRRQSECFEFARPEEVEQDPFDALRRQSSAFEFRSNFVEPIYENLTRDFTRGSLRRRNSSVKDLVLKLESEAKKRVGVPDLVNNKPRLGSSDSMQSSSSGPRHNSGPAINVPEIQVELSRVSKPLTEPLRISEENDDPSFDGWVDASEFFKNVVQADAPQCGRSSIVKIRDQIKGRVQDSVTKFSQPGHTPVAPVRYPATPLKHPGTRRLSARMGTTVTTPRPTHTSSNLSATPGPASGRRLALTGIRTTTITGKRLSTYANPTISSTRRARDKSPIYEPVNPRENGRSLEGINNIKQRSPNPSITSAPQKVKKSPKEPAYQNVKVERKNSNSRDIKKHPVERSTSGSKGRKNRVKRNRSNAEKERTRRKEERRYLTIGYPGEIRSPLKERQNIPANIRRSNSDQTPSRAGNKSGEILTRSKLRDAENMYANMANVVRKHSLKSDVLMSPHLVRIDQGTPARLVKRTASERSTPRSTPYTKGVQGVPITPSITMSGHRRQNIELMRSLRMSIESPRRSPRLANC
eukprot:GFUD01044233.1.p1 GENE.GFUD01044233.1~~GFUD01044233.1.p1  ORF type:complete len:1367 (-),score=336.91 GFUD01044233.1:86-4186(-)